MELRDFESMVGRAGYVLEKEYELVRGHVRRVYKARPDMPRINVQIERTRDGDVVDELHALTIEWYLNDQGYI